MRPNSNTLAMRDPAMASLMGLIKGSDFGADPTDEQRASAWDATASREALIEPNKGSTVKVQRYAFGLETVLALATASAFTMTGNPDTNIRPQRVTCNAPVPGFARISGIKVANVGCIIGGRVDAFDFSHFGEDEMLDVPTLTPSNAVRVDGDYSGLLPLGGYLTATPFVLMVSFKGPANITG